MTQLAGSGLVIGVNAASEELTEDVLEESKEEVLEEPTEDVSEEATENVLEELTEDVSEEATEDDSNQAPGMSSSYVLSADQIKEKKTAKSYLSDIKDAEEGVDYAVDEVIFIADTLEEAEEVAKGYKASLLSYNNSVAVLQVASDENVVSTMEMAADVNNNLPAVWPNYYRETFEDSNFASGDSTIARFEDPLTQENITESQWQHTAVGSKYAWKEGYTGKSIGVAVIDSGMRYFDNELDPMGANTYRTDDEGETIGDAYDENGHGTHVAGIIGAMSNDYGGCGIAPDCDLYNLRAMDSEGRGKDSDIVAAMFAAVNDYGVEVINMSLGNIEYSDAYQQAVDYAYQKGVVVVVAAGNNNNDSPMYPAACDHAISVAAISANNERAYFSSFGNTVDVSAPGNRIFSVGYDGNYNIEYVPMDGTSMACPVVSGEVAVILSAKLPQIENKTGKARVDAVEKLLKSSATPVEKGMGAGVVSLPKALNISTMTQTPKAPVIMSSAKDGSPSTYITMEAESGVKVYYSLNGKTPDLKNYSTDEKGTTKWYNRQFFLNGASSYTIKAIAVNDSGLVSKVTTKTVCLKPRVGSITISGGKTMSVNDTLQLKATILPAAANNKKATWSVYPSSKGITVSSNGKVTTKEASVGTYEVRAKALDDSGCTGFYYIDVTEANKINKLFFINSPCEVTRNSISAETISMYDQIEYESVPKGEFLQSTDFDWFCSNNSIATINDRGDLRTKKAGTVTVTAVSKDINKKTAKVKVVIKQKATEIKLDCERSLIAGKSTKLTTEFIPADTSVKKATYEVTPADGKVTVSNGKVVTKKGAVGKYTITATAADQSGKTSLIYIEVFKTGIEELKFDEKEVTIFRTPGNNCAPTEVSLSALRKGEVGNEGSYTVISSNPDIATAEEDMDGFGPESAGVLVKATGNKIGTTIITLKSTDGSNKKTTCKVNVVNPPSQIDVYPANGMSHILVRGHKVKFSAAIRDSFGKTTSKVNWSVMPSEDQYFLGENAEELVQYADANIDKNGYLYISKDTIVGTKFDIIASDPNGSGVYGEFTIITEFTIDTLEVKGIQVMDPSGEIMDIDFEAVADDEDFPVHLVGKNKVKAEGLVGKDFTLVMNLATNENQDGRLLCGTPDIMATSSNKKSIFSLFWSSFINYDVGVYDDLYYLDVSILKEGTSTITLKSMDGSNKTQKVTIIATK